MKPTPTGWPRCSTSLCYEHAAQAIDWLVRAFGLELRLRVDGEGGKVEHSELTFGDAVFMVSDVGRGKFPYRRVPSEIGGGNTQCLFVYVDDVEAHCTQARASGAVIVTVPETHDYGREYWSDRTYECVDCGGHHWFFAERLRTGAVDG